MTRYQLTYEATFRPVTIIITASSETECWIQLQNILNEEVKAQSADITVTELPSPLKRLKIVDAYGNAAK